MHTLLLLLLLLALALAHAYPHPAGTATRTPIGTITCHTTADSPSTSDLRALGALAPYPDGRGFCFTLAALCPGQFNTLCADSGRTSTVRVADRGGVVVEAAGSRRNMEMPCADVGRGIDEIVGRCERGGRVAGQVRFEGGGGKGYATVVVRGR